MKKYHILSIMLAWKKVNHIWSIDGYSGIKLLFFSMKPSEIKVRTFDEKKCPISSFRELTTIYLSTVVFEFVKDLMPAKATFSC